MITVAPGLYEICLGFYSKKRPQVTVHVNGEAVMTLMNESNKVEVHSSERIRDVGSHPNGNITGLTLLDYFSLPPRARINLVYDGDYKVEGFFARKKL